MGNAIDILDKRSGVKYYDTKIATNADTVVEKGDVLDMNVTFPRTVVIDDTFIDDVPKERKAMYHDITNGSMLKLKIILKKKPPIIATKLTLAIFSDTKGMCNLLANSGYKIVMLAKYGKLHNQEVFLILSLTGGRPRNSNIAIGGDIEACCVSVQVANHIIMIADSHGVTLSASPQMWRRVLGCVPVVWGWYHEKIRRDNPCTGGYGGVGAVMDADMTVEFENTDLSAFMTPEVKDAIMVKRPSDCKGDLGGCKSYVCFDKYVTEKAKDVVEKQVWVNDGRYLVLRKGDAKPGEGLTRGRLTVVLDFKATEESSYLALAMMPCEDPVMYDVLIDLVLTGNPKQQGKAFKFTKVKV